MKRAITLIELLIVIVFLFILTGSVSWVFVISLKAWNSGISRADIRQDGNSALERMVRELGMANVITRARADEIRFEADLDNDGTDEEIEYTLDGTNLFRTEGGSDTTMASNVEVFGLSYRDLNDILMTLPSGTSNQAGRDTIRVIIITLDMSNGDEIITLSSAAYARNQ